MKTNTPLAIIATGLVLVAIGLLTQRLAPLLGRVAFQAAASGSYTPTDYALPLTEYYVVALGIIVLGIGSLLIQRRSDK